MANNDKNAKQRRIYLKHEHRWVDVSEKFYKDYYQDIDAFRKKIQYHGKCVCPKSKRYLCDMDCCMCEFAKAGDMLSLDYTVKDEDGNEKSWLDDVADLGPEAMELVADSELLDALCRRLAELNPEQKEICHQLGLHATEREAAEALGLPRNTYVYRRDKVLALLRQHLKDYI